MGSLFTRSFDDSLFVFPSIVALLILALTGVVITNIVFPRYRKKILEDLDNLIPFETAYKKDLWRRVRNRVADCIEDKGFKHLWVSHSWYRKRLKRVLDRDIGRLKNKW